jgi:hypothetical protein
VRAGSLSINGQTFSVSQASGCTFQINPSSQSAPAGGSGNTDIHITAANACQWTATTAATWITITTGSGTGNGTAKFTVGANTGPARSGTISIAQQQTFTVNQASGCTFQLSPTTATIAGAAGSGGSVTVTTAPGCMWTASSNSTWLSIAGPAGGTGSGTVAYTAQANPLPGHQTRAGSLTIANITFNVTQNNP